MLGGVWRSEPAPRAQAASLPKGSIERMVQVAAFAISGYSGTARRTNKPFNPLLGETFEFVCQEQGMRLLIEKVHLIQCMAAPLRDPWFPVAAHMQPATSWLISYHAGLLLACEHIY